MCMLGWMAAINSLALSAQTGMTHIKLVNITVLWDVVSCVVVDLYHLSKVVEILTQGCTNTSP